MKRFIIPLTLALTLTSCGAKPVVDLPSVKKVKTTEEKRALIAESPVSNESLDAIDLFADKTADILFTSGNVNYSPISLYYALAVANLGGADDNKLIELLGVEQFDGISTSITSYGDEISFDIPSGTSAALSNQCSNLWDRLCLTGEYTDLLIANSVWSANGIKEDFANTAAEKYHAECFDSLSSSDMSNWIKEKTNGTLAPQIELLADQNISILNTIYFKAEWTDKFEKSANEVGIFHTPSGDVETTFMQSTEIKGFKRGENFTTASRSFKDGGNMTIVLPDEGVEIRDLLEEYGLINLLESGESKSGHVIWYFPKFEFDFEFSAKNMLLNLGLDEFFAENAGMAKNITDENTTISDIKQGTHISVDEKGVTASAYTNIMYAGSPMPEDTADMHMDRPFLYAVYYENVLLFVGIVDDPTQN